MRWSWQYEQRRDQISDLELCSLLNRGLEQATFLSHGQKRDVNISPARTVVSHRFSNQSFLLVKRFCILTNGDGNGAFSHDVTAAILVFWNKETAAMLVYQTKPLGIELHFHANFSFCGMKLIWTLVTWVKTLYRQPGRRKSAYLMSKNRDSCTICLLPARAVFNVVHFFALCERMTSNDQIWSPVGDVNTWRLNLIVLSIFLIRPCLFSS